VHYHASRVLPYLSIRESMHIYWYLNTYILFNLYTFIGTLKEEFEDTKGVIRFRKSKDKQHNDQKKKKKRSTKHYTEN
jgi:hypothetical protein